MQSQPAARLNEVIAGKYRIESLLGTGGMGVVYAATQLDLDRLVAVKVMRAELTEHAEAVERVVQEAKLAAQFRSEHVCKVLDVGTLADGSPYIVMEHLDGVDLGALLIERGRFSVHTAIDFVLEACEALAEAHVAQVVHRDLKPENLFVAKRLDGSPTIKILDFGISKRLGATQTERHVTTNPSALLGSPHYMAPEQMLAAKDVDCRADLWALGAILFELLSGEPAFDGDTVPEVGAAVMAATPKRVSELRPELSEHLADVVARCLQKKPAARYANVAELAAALVPFGSAKAKLSLKRIYGVFAGHARVRVRSLPAASRIEARRSSKRRRTAWWTAGVTLLFCLLAALTLLFAGSRAQTRTTPPNLPAPSLPAPLQVMTTSPQVALAESAKSAPQPPVAKARLAVQHRPTLTLAPLVSAARRDAVAGRPSETWDTDFGQRR